MRSFILLIIFTVLVSCGKIINEPKVLIQQDTMAQVIADLALADQFNMSDFNYQPSEETQYILKKYKINIKDFKESYTYYIAINKINSIYDKAQDIIINKDAKSKMYIQKKLDEEKKASITTETPQLKN